MTNPLIGIWHLISWTLTDGPGMKHFPFGENASGCLLYTPDNFMSVHLMKQNRNVIQQSNIFEISPQDAIDCYKSYVSYCGEYHLLENKVRHIIQLHTNPNWIGTIQDRYFKIHDNNLHLSHELDEFHSELLWKKFSFQA